MYSVRIVYSANMFLIPLFLLLLLSCTTLCLDGIQSTELPTTDTIRLIDSGPLWTTTERIIRDQARSLHRRNSEEDSDVLNQFLSKYEEMIQRRKPQQHHNEGIEMVTKPNYNEEQPKSWSLMHVQKHKPPYDDKNGWVSMDPVPWSVSKISKWQSTKKPSYDDDYDDYPSRPWPRPGPSFHQSVTVKPNGYEGYYVAPRPEIRPMFPRPAAQYGQKVHINYANKNDNCDHRHQHSDIITDGLPANFPDSAEMNRRRSTDHPPNQHPFLSDGEWVLLATTKGFKYPQNRQRSLELVPQSISTQRGVRLTVLPPLKNSKINMTTSHGGLLQVESTFQTVEQAKNQYLQQTNKKPTKPKLKVTKIKQNLKRVPHKVAETVPIPTITAATTTNRNPDDSSALLAAVGAGMIPATMAMLVPMAMGGKRRRKRDVPGYQLKIARYL